MKFRDVSASGRREREGALTLSDATLAIDRLRALREGFRVLP